MKRNETEEFSVVIAQAVRGAARDRYVWCVYQTSYGLFAEREGDGTRFKVRKRLATVRHIRENIIDVTHEDGRVERCYV